MGVVNHVVKVRRRTVSVCDARIVANNVDVDTVTLDLDSEWDGLSTVVAFGDGDDQVMVSVGVEPVEIPRSLTTASGYLPVTVIGYGGDGLPRMVTAAAPHAMIFVNSGVIPDQSYPDAPDLIGQLVTAGDKANEAADNANAAAGNANAAVDRASELAGKLGDIDAQVTDARGSAEAAANSAQQAAASASAAQTSERNAANSAMQASQSATAAKQSEDNAAESERNAASSAEQAANVVASVSGSVTQAENAARSASQSATSAAGSANAAGGSAQAAADSASKAGESATAAKTSETNAASSASAAKVSETNAADSATAAQNAVDGFGLTVGSVTTGEPGTDAAVDIAKQGTKYVAGFTIPRGDKGEQASVEHDDTLTGDGTAGNPLGAVIGSAVNQTFIFSGDSFDLNNLTDFGIFAINNDRNNITNIPTTPFRGCVFVTNNGYSPSNKSSICQVALCRSWNGTAEMYTRVLTAGIWNKWTRMAFVSDIPDVSAITASIAALHTKMNELAVTQTRLQALEARVKSLETN